jgi:hypothetical protein
MAEIYIDEEAKELWHRLMDLGAKIERRVTHGLEDYEAFQIISSIPPKASEPLIHQMTFDLMTAKYKLYDEAGMLLTGRCKDYPGQTEEEEKVACEWGKELAKSYIDCAEKVVALPEFERMPYRERERAVYSCVLDEQLPKRAGRLLIQYG